MAKRVLVSGATGLIGSALVKDFASDGHFVFAAARDVEKARVMFDGLANVDVVEWDVLRSLDIEKNRISPIDWFVHAAAGTTSRLFVEKPVETIQTIFHGTENALEAARKLDVGAMVYLSTMEVYGVPMTDRVTERDYGYLDPVAVRSCYPEAKRLAENLCVSYAKEYGVPVKIARLAQTFGEGVRRDDMRVFAVFARAILEKRDIVLKTDGTTARCYCYLGDAVAAIKTILERGETAVPYTVANEDTFCTIREMAEALCAACPQSGSKVVFDIQDAAACGFAPPFKMKLDSSRLRALGWVPKVGLMEAFRRMMGGMRKMVLAVACSLAFASDATQHALVVGINEYTNPGCSTLNGCVTDANRMQRLLTTGGGGWRPEDVMMLTNAAASRAAILDAIRAFADRAVPGDTFVYSHSSHGGNQVLCAADQNISATDLGPCLKAFTNGVTVLCVIDACHAGSLPNKGNGRAPMDFATFVADVEKAMNDTAVQGKRAALKAVSADVGWCVAVDAANSSLDLGAAFGGLFTYPFIQRARSGAADATCFTCQGVNLSHGNGDGDCTAEEAFWSAYDTSLVWSDWQQAPQIFNSDVCAKVVLAKASPADINVAADTDLHFDSYAYDSVNYGKEGGVGFFGQTATSYDGNSALACSPVLPYQVCVLETCVTAEKSGTLSFRWRTSSDVSREARHLHLLVDGKTTVRYSGDAWQQESVTISGEGVHVVQWEYYVTRKDMYVSDTADENCAYIDMIEWTERSADEPPAAVDGGNEFLLEFADAGEFKDKGSYNGYILKGHGERAAAGAVVGLITAKVSKPRNDGRGIVTAVITISGHRKVVRLKGTAVRNADDARQLEASLSGGGVTAVLSFLHKTAWGWINVAGDGYWCDMSRTATRSQAFAATRGNYVLGAYSRSLAEPSGDEYVGLSVQVRANGLSRFSGVLPDGTRICGRTTAVADDYGVYVPVFARVNSNKGSFCGFIVDITHNRLALGASGLWEAKGAGGNTQAVLVFDVFDKVRDDPPTSANYLFESFGNISQTIGLKFNGWMWTKAISDGKNLRLAYRPKTGTVKGGFTGVTTSGDKVRISCDGIYVREGGPNGMAMMTMSAKGKVSSYAIIK